MCTKICGPYRICSDSYVIKLLNRLNNATSCILNRALWALVESFELLLNESYNRDEILAFTNIRDLTDLAYESHAMGQTTSVAYLGAGGR